MKYDFNRIAELAWFAAVAAGTFLLVLAVDFDPDTVTSWQAYVVAAGGGMVRAAAAAILARMGR